MRLSAFEPRNPRLLSELCWFVAGLLPLAITGCGGQSHADHGAAGGSSGAGTLGGMSAVTAGSSAAGGPSGHGGAGAASGGAETGGETSASAGSTPIGGGGNALPADDRPAAPEWKPTISLGTPGWEMSQQAFCDPHQGAPRAYGVWADARGVYMAVSEDCGINAGSGGVPCGKEGLGLHFNDGNGWQVLFADSKAAAARLRGFPAGPLILLGFGPPDTQSDSVSFVSDSMLSVQPPLGLGDGASGQGIFGVDADHAYAFALHVTDSPSTTVRKYAAGSWSTLGIVPIINSHAIWADENQVVVVGTDQDIYVKSGSAAFAALPDVPAGDYWSVWGFSAQDLWFGNSVGQLVHYDGASWKVIQTSATGPISSLWGADGQVYFTAGDSFGRWNGTSVETLIASTSGLAIADVWGRSSSEVFLAVSDPSFADYQCGRYFAVWFDGTKFHQF